MGSKHHRNDEKHHRAKATPLPKRQWLHGKFKLVAETAGRAVVTDATIVGSVTLLMRLGFSMSTGLGVAAAAFGAGKGIYSYGSDYWHEWKQAEKDGHHVYFFDGERAKKATVQLLLGTGSGLVSSWLFQPGTLKLGLDIVAKLGGDTIGGFAQELGTRFLGEAAVHTVVPAAAAAGGAAAGGAAMAAAQDKKRENVAKPHKMDYFMVPS